ncbi:MAG: hypothetical protein MUP85_20395, partial [Candidatus Lokiarchaeota archaeon]|nr:hypothetical protein [Candidatus Lokiarchaeota archaeon]
KNKNIINQKDSPKSFLEKLLTNKISACALRLATTPPQLDLLLDLTQIGLKVKFYLLLIFCE